MFIFKIEDISYITCVILEKNKQDIKNLEKAKEIDSAESISFYESELKRNEDILSKMKIYINENYIRG